MTQSSDVIDAIPPAPAPAARRAPAVWGAWATLAWTIGGLVLFVLSQVGVLAAFFGAGWLPRAVLSDPQHIMGDAPLVAAAEAVSAIVMTGYFVFAARLSGLGAVAYLALKAPRKWQVAVGVAAIVAVEGIAVAVALVGGYDPGPSPMDSLGTAHDPWSIALTVVAVMLLAPIQEEIAFRGFALPGIARDWGVVAAVVITAVIWASLHLTEYDAFGIAEVFALGIAFGWLRVWSGSTLLTIGLHVAVNTVATVPGWLPGS